MSCSRSRGSSICSLTSSWPTGRGAAGAGEGDGAEVEPKIAHRTAAGSAAGWAHVGAQDSPAPTVEIHGFPQGSTSRRGVEPWTFCAVSRRPSHRSPIRKWFGEPPGIGPNRGVFGSGPLGGGKAQFAGKKRRTTPNQVLFAMQKGRGFESHQPLGSPCKSTIFFFPGSSIEVLTIMQKVPGWDVLNELGTLSARAWSPSAAPARHFSRRLTIG